MGGRAIVVAAMAALFLSPAAPASGWLPHAKDATWTYEWTDTVYNTTPTKEKVTVAETVGDSFTLAWTTADMGNAAEAPSTAGTVTFQDSAAGILNLDWRSTPAPPRFPILCATVSLCNNSLSSTMYQVIWGTRGPVLSEPLLKGTSWTSTGGAQGDVTSQSDYIGIEEVTVPAFPGPVKAAKIRAEVTQAGAIGDPYGSGVRTIWWVYGVGPVKVTFEHAGGNAPVTTSVLVTTNQQPKAHPLDDRYFPLVKGAKLKYSFRNTKYLKKPSIQQFTTDEVVNGSASFSVKHVSGPIRVAGAYGFTMRADGATNIWAQTKSASLTPFPALGPDNVPKDRRRRFTTPFDLMLYGFNPILPAYPVVGATWGSLVPSRDYSIFGVTGFTKVLGIRTVKVPAGTYRALVLESRLAQKGFKFGSGVRTSYFAPDKGLVKLVFAHADRSVSTVELLG